jgi:serine/threonine protein kinase
VIHRDIKPTNMMITGDDLRTLKLLDFGLARSTFEAEHTRPGSIVGSLHYMSPEQVCGEKVDARTDLYSLGATAYELVTGSPPFEGESAHAIMDAHLRQMPKPPEEINPSLPKPLSHILLQALAKNPDERFQTAEEFLRALETLRLEWTAILPPQEVHTKIRGPYRPSSGTQVSQTPKTPSTPSRFSPSALQKVSEELAVYIGPIANIVVERAAAKYGTLNELYIAVAREIDSSKDREKFLASRAPKPD